MAADQNFISWALPQVKRVLPLDDDALSQVVEYALTLGPADASDHLQNLLGDSPQVLEFISAFNQRRPGGQKPQSSQPAQGRQTQRTEHDGVPARANKGKQAGKKKNFNALPPPRRVDDFGQQGAYQKRDLQADYMPSSGRGARPGAPSKPLANTLALQGQPDMVSRPAPSRPDPAVEGTAPMNSAPKLPPSAQGPLISDAPSPKPSRTASPAPQGNKTKAKATANLTGGTSMRGPSSALADLDSAIRQLEQQTNPSLDASSTAETDLRARRCNCQAQRHALLAAAPNCLNCGKIVCAKEGLGPCTSCGSALLSRDDLAAMLRALKDERGRERMASHNAQHKRADISGPAMRGAMRSGTATPASGGASSDDDGGTSNGLTGEAAALARARAHRDRLLGFQAQNARRTTVHDEAADVATPDVGTSMWASPQERALQLKRQQATLRAQEWAARPEHEKRRMVVSIDVGPKGKAKAVRRFEDIPAAEAAKGVSDEDEEGFDEVEETRTAVGNHHSGAGFARNPLLGKLTRPVWTAPAGAERKGRGQNDASAWRRVQDDGDDNEQWILDGGAYGGDGATKVVDEDGMPCG